MITIDNQKQCGKCKEWMPATNEFFFKNKKSKLGLDWHCKSCSKRNSKKWWVENPGKSKEYGRKRAEKNPEREREYARRWRKNNPEQSREKSRKWRKNNLEKSMASDQRRRARKSNAVGTSSAEQIKARFQYHENRCYYCGDNESGLHIEHRIPLSRGGSNWPANLVPACPSCNLSKNTKTEKEFINQ